MCWFSPGEETVVTNRMRSVEGIAVDWVSENLYYTDNVQGLISVVRLRDNQFDQRRDLLTNLGNPRAIVMHPHLGWVLR